MKCELLTREETQRFAETVACHLAGGTLILLNGELGAGKTCFTKFLASSLGVADEVSSPTYVLECVYQGAKYSFHHWDLYRLRTESEDVLHEIAEARAKGAIVCVEWANRIPSLAGAADLVLTFLHSERDEHARHVEVALLREFHELEGLLKGSFAR